MGAAPAVQNGITKYLPIVALALILVAAGAYYFFVMAPAGSAPITPSLPIAQPGAPPPQGNLSQETPSLNATAEPPPAPPQNAAIPAPPPPSPPLPGNGAPAISISNNSSAGNSSNATAKTGAAPSNATANTTTSAPPPIPNANATAAPSENATGAPTANATNSSSGAPSTANLSFDYTHKFTSYYPERLVWFCTDRGMEFYRMHWTGYFGGGCGVERPTEGYVGLDEYLATGCSVLPCCVGSPNSEYSLSYDYFECGFNLTS